MARAYADGCMRTLGGWALEEATDPDIRIRAIAMLLDRGFGKPESKTEHTGEDGGDIKITIRNIMEGKV